MRIWLHIPLLLIQYIYTSWCKNLVFCIWQQKAVRPYQIPYPLKSLFSAHNFIYHALDMAYLGAKVCAWILVGTFLEKYSTFARYVPNELHTFLYQTYSFCFQIWLFDHNSCSRMVLVRLYYRQSIQHNAWQPRYFKNVIC